MITLRYINRPFFLTYVDLYTKMCRIKFKETFRTNVGVSDLSKKSYLRKTVHFKKFKSLRSHNKKMKR